MTTPADDRAPERLRTTPSWLLTRLSDHAAHLARDAFAAAGAGRYHYALLVALEEGGPASQAALGRRCGIDRSDVVAALNELVERGHAERRPDPTDRRRNVVTVTPAGREQARRTGKALDEVQDRLLAPLASEDRDRFADLLTRLLRHHAPGRL
ncbi:MarR family winged helix-turn-helix transcriptional regulator [Streptomyces sp. ST2-7A]|uniref:MarR family winged helix-turn-helix transcriptional regulator n=1 Tax=Streptomyces sp. ST2-7A TaxID=2907214 RepID=UPI001F2AAFE5|nr:MarR family winged helix-turn-helix transcriptional regulator [Streptomyces sp. ST2-7A]MCE7081474.1 MarR family winged helix-turn-helix transcriptional regulator [Streptomyces sp. ST2-7A]